MTPNDVAREFDKRHGQFVIVGEYPGVLIHQDGSKRENNPLGFYMHAEDLPPVERCRNKLRFQEELLKRAQRSFENQKQQLVSLTKANQRQGFPPPGSTELDKLKELRKAVKQAQEGAEAARAELSKLTPNVSRDDEMRGRYLQEGESFLCQLSEIEV